MKDQVAVALMVVALIVGAGIAFSRTPVAPTRTITKTYTIATTARATTTETYTITATLNQGSNLVVCVVVYYEVDAAELLVSSSTSYGSTTFSHQVSNYTTITSVEQPVGYATSASMTVVMSGISTHTGPVISSWDETKCTWVP